MLSYSHEGTVSLSDSVDDFLVDFFGPELMKPGPFELPFDMVINVRNRDTKGKIAFVIDRLDREKGKWEEVEKVTLSPGEDDRIDVDYPVPAIYRIKLKWVMTTHTAKVEYYFDIESDKEFCVAK